jgi:nucleoside-diphosphate-sugar epimerase
MNILITGATGLVGSALVEKLRGEDELFCQSRRAHDESDGVRWIEHDLADGSWEELNLPDFDVVYHLAGQTSTYSARNDPLTDLAINVTGFVTLLEYLRKQRTAPFVVLAGTATQVGLTQELPIREDMPDRPVPYYDISKLTAELYLKQYVREGWLNGCTLRLGNVFGGSRPGQQRDRGILDKVFATAKSGGSVTVYGDGMNLRDYVYIDDVVSALIVAPRYASKTNGQSFNIGSGRGVRLKEAFEKVVALAQPGTGGRPALEHVESPSDLSDIEKRNAVIDSSAFTAATGWTPKFDFEAGLDAAYVGGSERKTRAKVG